MNYAQEILQEKLNVLNNSYDEYVTNGKVNKDSAVALENRRKASELKAAILCLFAVSNSVCSANDKVICQHRVVKEYCHFKNKCEYQQTDC